jgi:hypothetical protein
VKRLTTVAPLSQGGLKTIDIGTYTASLRTAWLARFCIDPDAPGWRSYLHRLLRPYGGISFLACNYDMRYFPGHFPIFYKRALSDWFSLPKRPGPPSSVLQLAQIILWHNKDLLIGKKPFFFSEWAESGIFYLGQLFEADGSFLSYASFLARFGRLSGVDWLRLAQVRGCIPNQWRLTFLSDFASLGNVEYTIPPVPLFFEHKTFSFKELAGCRSKVFYSNLCSTSYVPPVSLRSWSRVLGIGELLSYFTLLVRLKLPPWYTSFQWKLLHRLIPTGRYLFLRRLRQSEECIFCDEPVDDLEHYFFYCECVREIWGCLEDRLNELGIDVLITRSDALVGSLNGGIPLNIIFVWTRAFLYRSKLQEIPPSFPALLGVLKFNFFVLRSLSFSASRNERFAALWKKFLPLFT